MSQQAAPPSASSGKSGLSPAKRKAGLPAFLRGRKAVALGAVGLILLLIGGVIAPNIPQQMRRSAAFQAMSDGDYETAALELETYTKDRPNDAEAGLQYAMAALHIGDIAAARAAFGKFSGADLAAREDFTLGHILARLDSPDAVLPLLDSVVSRNSQSAAAYLIRGVLRANEGDLRRARDDFLQADVIIRGYAEEDLFLPLAHKILLQTAARSSFSASSPPPKSSVPVEGRLGFPLGASGFANQYALPGDSEFLRDSPPQSAIPALFYASMLIQSGQYQEAETELRQASSLAPDLLMVANLEAFLLLHQGKFTEAAQKLSGIVDRAPNSTRTLLNLANAQWSENPDPSRWESAAAAYDGILSAAPEPLDAAVALNNRGHLRAFGGNLKGAREDFVAAIEMIADAEGENADELLRHARFNRAVIDLAEGNSAEVLDELEKLAEERFPGASRALVAAAEIAILPERAARYRAALTSNGDHEPLLASALYYERRGLLLRALWTLDQLPTSEGAGDLANFRRGRILAKLQNIDAAKGQLEDIQDPRVAGALRAIVAAAQGDDESAIALYREALFADSEPPAFGNWAEYVESLGEWLAPEWPSASDLESLPLDFYPRLAALSARALTRSDPDEARRLAELAVRVWPNDFLVLLHAGIALGRLGDAASGLSLLERALDGYPANEDLLKAMQEFRAEVGDREGALRAAETLFNIANPPGASDGAFQMVGIPKELGGKLQKSLADRDYDSALDVYKQALRTARNENVRNSLLYHRAALLRANQRASEALPLLDQLLTESEALDDRQRAAALAARGQSRQQEGDDEEAGEDFRQAAKLDPSQSDYLRRAALISSDPAAGLEEVIRRFPSDPRAYWDLAEMYRKEGKFARVIRVMRRMARVNPGNSDIYKTLGETQATAGHSRDAAVNKQIYIALTGAK